MSTRPTPPGENENPNVPLYRVTFPSHAPRRSVPILLLTSIWLAEWRYAATAIIVGLTAAAVTPTKYSNKSGKVRE